MKIRSFYEKRRRLSLATIIIMGIVIVLASLSFASDRKVITPNNFAPIYADWYRNDGWVAFIFYRDPASVPVTFNLLDFYDLAAFGVPLTVEGFAIYKNQNDPSPFQAEMKGLGAVPIWFITREDYTAAIGDGVLTISELESLTSLTIGSAHFYTETLHSEGHSPMPLKNVEASGSVEDGSRFSLKIIWVGEPSDPIVYLVKITVF
jgi:hypothetical protein